MSDAVAEQVIEQPKTKEFVIAMPYDARQSLDEAFVMFDNSEQFQIESQSDYDHVVDVLKKVKQISKTATEYRNEATRPLEAAKKALIAEYKFYQDRLEEIEKQGKAAMLEFQKKEQKRAELEQAEADERARKEREKLEKRAETAANNGKIEKAEELEAQSLAVQSETVQTNVPKVKGVSTSKSYEGEITDKAAFIKEALENPVFAAVIDVDMKKLNRIVKSLDGQLKMAGLRIKETSSVRIRA